MWGIGIRTSVIILLALIAYMLLLQIMNLQDTIWGHLEHLIFMFGIYLAHYYYKYANNNYMTYRQGLEVGMITVLCTSLLISLLTYVMTLVYGDYFTHTLLEALKFALQQANPDSSFAQDKIIFMYNPNLLIIVIFLSIFFTGFIFTLFVTLFSRKTREKIHQ